MFNTIFDVSTYVFTTIFSNDLFIFCVSLLLVLWVIHLCYFFLSGRFFS